MSKELTELTGEYVRLFRAFENGEDDDQTRTIIGVLKPFEWPQNIEKSPFGEITIKGRDDDNELVPGMPYRLIGKFTEYRGQTQFTYQAFVQSDPHNKVAVVKYLKKYAPGIGDVIANRLWEQYGSNAVSVLRTNPDKAANDIKKLDPNVAKSASQELQRYAKFEETRIDLIGLFDGRGFPGSAIQKCIKLYGVHAVERIKKNPFCLLVDNIPGAGFSRCDRLYIDLGLKPDSLKRAMLAGWHAMKSDLNGHTWFNRRQIERHIRNYVGSIPITKIDRAIQLGIKAGWLSAKTDHTAERWIACDEHAEQETELASSILKLITD